MPVEKVYKTVCQYNRETIPEEDMKKLLDIARDYAKVKNETYGRYNGIRALKKLYPGYTIQKELADSGLREQLKLPSVYFNLAVFDALGDIKSEWSRTKSRILEKINKNDIFSVEEKHYLRFLLKVNNCFAAVLLQEEPELPKELWRQREELLQGIDAMRLHRYLCRQVRSCHKKLYTSQNTIFSMTERAYRYGNHGIFISTKENRKRIFVPLTDNNQYQCQLTVKLLPEEGRIEIYVPVQVKVRQHAGYVNQVGLAMGMHTMLTTDQGHCYGEDFGKYQLSYAAWLREQSSTYGKNKANNPGRKKYQAKKHRLEEQLHGYINQELNRMFREEQPETIFIVKLPKKRKMQGNKQINQSVSLWQRGYIKKRLEQKCREQGVELVEVLGKDISRECSQCGTVLEGASTAILHQKSMDAEDGIVVQNNAITQNGITAQKEKAVQESGADYKKIFYCPVCGFEIEEKTNTARNVKKRGLAGLVIR